MRALSSLLLLLLCLGLASATTTVAPPAEAAPVGPAGALPTLPSPAVAPLAGPVVREFDAPEPDWLPGHRGVDLAGSPGAAVRAAAAGSVAFAGPVAGKGVVVVWHGDVRTTYEPVAATVRVGDEVAMGDMIGTLLAGHPGCETAACLHWGLKHDEVYLDPRLLLGPRTIRLVPTERAGWRG